MKQKWAIPSLKLGGSHKHFDKEREIVRSPTASRAVRSLVKARDRVCQHCGHKGSYHNKLTVHHVKPRRSHPELVNDPNNCVTLCENCHRKLERGDKKE